MEIVMKTYRFTRQLPEEEKFGLRSQLNRAVVSVPSNIAEGASRSSKKEYQRFLEIALGSAFEVETQVRIIKELYSLDESSELLKLVQREQKMLNSLISRLKGTETKDQ